MFSYYEHNPKRGAHKLSIISSLLLNHFLSTYELFISTLLYKLQLNK
jgi:hypothetical protein